MRGTRPCPRCGAEDPETAEPVEAKKRFFGAIQLPVLPLVALVVGGLGFAGLSTYTATVKNNQARNRIWESLGSSATEERVREVEAQAVEIGVSTDVLVRVRFVCLHRELQRPPIHVLREARLSAVRNDKDPEAAVIQVATAACRQR